MRKLYLLLAFLAVLADRSKAQDSVRFTFSIGLNNDVTFLNTSSVSGDGKKAFWTFGDGTRVQTPALSGAFHHYATAGTYNACLRIFSYTASGDSTIIGETCHSVTLTATNADLCGAEFTDTSYAGTNQRTKLFVAQPKHNNQKKPERICWNFGDGKDTCINYDPQLPNNYAVYHSYAQSGAYNVCTKIIYQGGCQSTYCREVRVASGDGCRVEVGVEKVTASPLSRQIIAHPFNSLLKKPLRICWIFGDGKDTCVQYPVNYTGSYNVLHTYSNYGTYNVCVKVLFDGGCETQLCRSVTLSQPSPLPVNECSVQVYSVTASGNQLERRFYAGTNPNRTVEKICWNFGDGTDTCIFLSNTSTSINLSVGHRYPGPGVYRTCAQVWYAGGCTATKCTEVSIKATTNICGGYLTDSFLNGRSLQFRGYAILNANDHPVSWRWTFGDGTAATGQQVVHNFAAGGQYNVCLNIRTDLGCETRICKTITLPTSGSAQLSLSPNPVVNVLHAVFQSTLQETVIISIFNANGVQVRSYTRAATAGTNTWDFDLSGLPSGIYSMVIHSPGQLATAIFFKQ